MRVFILLLFTLVSLNSYSDSVMNAEFRTMKKCLAKIPKASKQNIAKIIRDTPKIVTGNLANGKTFACEKKVSGTKGVYYNGWFMVD